MIGLLVTLKCTNFSRRVLFLAAKIFLSALTCAVLRFLYVVVLFVKRRSFHVEQVGKVEVARSKTLFLPHHLDRSGLFRQHFDQLIMVEAAPFCQFLHLSKNIPVLFTNECDQDLAGKNKQVHFAGRHSC